MVLGIKGIERKFNRQRKNLLKNFEKVERKRRAQFIKVAAEFDKFTKREAILKRIESTTSTHLSQLNRRIRALNQQDTYDKRRIKQLLAEIQRLKKDIPKIEKMLKKEGVRRSSIATQERKFSSRLRKISGRVKEVEKRKDNMERELKKLHQKERMLQQGRIYWAGTVATSKKAVKRVKKAVKKRVKRRVKRVVKKAPKRGLVERILFHK